MSDLKTNDTNSTNNTSSNQTGSDRIKAALLDPRERISSFQEVSLGYNLDQAISEASRCLQCKKKFCQTGCPVGIDIPSFIKSIREKNFEESFSIIKEYNSFPAVCGRVCPQEKQCESQCILGKKGSAISIGLLERFVADWYAKTNEDKNDTDTGTNSLSNSQAQAKTQTQSVYSSGSYKDQLDRSKKYKVAIIGSGPSSLSVAGSLCKYNDIDIHIFEAFHRAGGVLVYGIPEFRLPKVIVQKEIDDLCSHGVKIHLNTVIGKTISLPTLQSDFDAIYIGVGAGLPLFLNVAGEELGRIFSASDYLTRNNLMYAYKFPQYDTPIPKADHVCVIGGGNVAMDAARTALRLGSKKVTLVYRRGMNELPARKEEISHAIEEGVEFLPLTAPLSFESDEEGIYVKRIKCIKMKLTEPDASGRARPVPIEGSEFYIDTDEVIVAIGSSANPILTSVSNLELNKKGYIQTDEFGKTSKKGIWAGGDIVTGAATVIAAMGAGKKAASSIVEYLHSK